MAYPKALSESEVCSVNANEAFKWIETNKRLIKAEPDKSILYSGRDYDLEELREKMDGVMKVVPLDQRKTFMGTPMYRVIQKKQKTKLEHPFDFQSLEDVLKTIRHHPKLITRDRQAVGPFAHAFEFFDELKTSPKLCSKPDADTCWKRLSGAYASNAVGHIKILDGVSNEFEKLGNDKILVNTELLALMKNSKLSPEAKAALLKVIPKYKEHLERFDKRYKEMKQQLAKDLKRLKP